VTGGANGIGSVIARTCHSEGAIPVIVDRDAEAGEKLVAELRRDGSASEFVIADLSSASNCAQTVERTISKFGRLDGLVNNAGTNDFVSLEYGSPEDFVKSLNQNLMHYYSMAHFALPFLKESRGTITNIGSKVAVTGQGRTSGYAAAKGAIMALTREWAAELLGYGIRVNTIIPSEVMTVPYRKWIDSFPHPAAKLESVQSKIPLGNRLTTVHEIAATTVFVLSGKSGHTTGQHIFVDGGYVHLDRALT
jgi:L-fucose dehydrogenase